jgi:hypothetical protein
MKSVQKGRNKRHVVIQNYNFWSIFLPLLGDTDTFYLKQAIK